MTDTTKRSSSKTDMLVIRVHPQTTERLRTRAEQEYRTPSEVVRRLIEEYLDKEPAKHNGASH